MSAKYIIWFDSAIPLSVARTLVLRARANDSTQSISTLNSFRVHRIQVVILCVRRVCVRVWEYGQNTMSGRHTTIGKWKLK